jgi:hypothetical protein
MCSGVMLYLSKHEANNLHLSSVTCVYCDKIATADLYQQRISLKINALRKIERRAFGKYVGFK